MGADLSMNPPAPDQYVVERDGYTLILMRKRDPIFQGEDGLFHEVWRGNDTAETVKLLEAAGHVVPPRPEDVTGTVVIDIVRVLKARCRVHGCRWEGHAAEGRPGAIDAHVIHAASEHAAEHGPYVTIEINDKTGA